MLRAWSSCIIDERVTLLRKVEQRLGMVHAIDTREIIVFLLEDLIPQALVNVRAFEVHLRGHLSLSV